MSQFSCGGLLPKEDYQNHLENFIQTAFLTHSHNSQIFLTGTLFPSCKFINHANHSQSDHFLKFYWLVILGTPDFPCVYHTIPLVLSWATLHHSYSSTPESGSWHMLFYTAQSLWMISSTHGHSFNYNQSTDISQTYHYSTNNNLQISIPNHLLILSPKMLHRFQKQTQPICHKSSIWPSCGIYIHPVTLLKFGKLFQTSPSLYHTQSPGPINFTF